MANKKTKKMKRVDVVKGSGEWVGELKSGDTYARGATKADAVRKTARKAKKDSRNVTVRIHGADGRVQEERTYPRGTDPRSSKG
jgi:hypothetical protein